MEHNARMIISLIGLTLLASGLKAAEATETTNAALPVVMEMNAVTLELVCRDGAAEGDFHPIRRGCWKQPLGAGTSSRMLT